MNRCWFLLGLLGLSLAALVSCESTLQSTGVQRVNYRTGMVEATPEEDAEIRQGVLTFQKALATRNGRSATDLVTAPTLRLFEDVRRLGFHSTASEMANRAKIFRAMVWMARHFHGREKLQLMTSRDLFASFVNRGVFDPVVQDMKTGVVQSIVLQPKAPQAEVVALGRWIFKYLDRGHMKQALVSFRGTGDNSLRLVQPGPNMEWKVAFEWLIGPWEVNMLKNAMVTRQSDEVMIRSWLKQLTGRAPAAGVFKD